MPQIKPTHLLISLAMALALAGCGDKNDKAVFSPESGHPSDWVQTHKASAQTDVASCTECHGEDYSGGISKVSCTSPTAVSGFTCHVSSPVDKPTECVSCHGGVSASGVPTGPFGSNDPKSAPNRQFAHTKHIALAGIGCDTCHLKAGTGTAGHAKADLAGGRKSATVNGAFVHNDNGTCSNVSCHGGKVTPAWVDTTEIIVANNNIDCLKCHAPATTAGIPGIPQYNSFYTGLHVFHLDPAGVNANCTDCHNIGTLTNFQLHFSGIATNTLTSPDKTIGNIPPTKIGSYAVSTKTCSNTVAGCHAGNHPGQWITAP
jgi:predicted CxxxxCH...CXXCH cytochrome family protein